MLDFGCGGGYLLQNLQCAEKIGIEVNTTAHSTCLLNGITVFDKIENMPEKYINYFDVIISHHALEHVPIPIIKKMILINIYIRGVPKPLVILLNYQDLK